MNETTHQRPMVSVIICTRDRPDDLARCLPTVLANDYANFEVIVVDQSMTDATQRVAERLAGPRLRYHRQHVVGKSRALNAAVIQAKGEVMALTDDDCTVPPDWLGRALDVLEEERDVGIVFGGMTAPPIDWTKTFVPTFLPPSYCRLQGKSAFLRVPKIGVGANMVVRRAVFERLNGFDECLGPGSRFRSGDDTDLTYRALRAGFTIVQDPMNTVVHWGSRGYADRSARWLFRNKYYGLGASFVKHLRCGDSLAPYILLRVAYRESRYIITSLRVGRASTGAGRLLYLMRGIVAGFRQPLDRRRCLYLATADDRL